MEFDKNAVAEAINSLARAVHALGTNNAGTQMGAIEYLAVEIREGSTRIAEGLNSIALAIENHD